MSDKYERIDAEKDAVTAAGERKYTVAAMCAWLGVSASGYYEWRDRPASATARRRDWLKLLINEVFDDSEDWMTRLCARRQMPTGSVGTDRSAAGST